MRQGCSLMPGCDPQWQSRQARLTSKQALGMSKITGLGKELLHKGRSPPTHGCLYTTPSAFVHRAHHMEAGSWEVDQPLLPLAEGVEQQD